MCLKIHKSFPFTGSLGCGYCLCVLNISTLSEGLFEVFPVIIIIYFAHYAFNIQDNKICLTSSNKIHRTVEALNFTDNAMVKKVNWSTTVPPAHVISRYEVYRFSRRLRIQIS